MVIKYNNVVLDNIIDGIQRRRTHDESLDGINFSRILTSLQEIPVGSLFDVDDVPYILESFNYEESIDGSYFIFTYNLIEGTILLQSIIMPNLTFTQRLNLSVTMKQVIDRLFRVCRPSTQQTNFFILDANFNNFFTNIVAPEFFFSNSTLFDALVQIGEYVDLFPRLIFNLNKEPVVITFDNLNVLSTPTITIQRQPLNVSHDLSRYANTFKISGSNLISTDEQIQYPISIPNDHELINEVTEMITINSNYDEVIVNDDGGVLTVNQPIFKVKKVEIFWFLPEDENSSRPEGWYKLIPLRNWQNFDDDDILENWIVNRKEWIGLKPKSFWQSIPLVTGAPRGKIRESTMYYDIGGYDIYNIQTCWTAQPVLITKYLDIDDSNGFSIPNEIFIAQVSQGSTVDKVNQLKLSFRVTYIPMVSNFEIIKQNDGPIDWIKSEILNGSFVDSKRAARYAQSQIKQALSRDFSYSTVLSLTSNVEEGFKIDNRLINTVSETLYNTYKTTNLGATTEFHRRSRYIDVERKPNPFEISTDRVTERILILRDVIELSDVSGSIVPQNYLFILGDFINNDNSVRIHPEYCIAEFTHSDNAKVYVNLPLNKLVLNESVLMKADTYDNIIVGVNKSTIADVIVGPKVRNQSGIIYTDSNGELVTAKITIGNKNILNMSRQDYQINFPLLTSNQVSQLPIITKNFYVEKDTRERLTFGVQVDFSRKNGFFVTDHMLQSTHFMKTNVTNKPTRIRLFNFDIDDNMKLVKNTTGTIIQSTIALINQVTINIPNTSFLSKSWAVYDENGFMLFGRNLPQLTIIAGSIIFYFNLLKSNV